VQFEHARCCCSICCCCCNNTSAKFTLTVNLWQCITVCDCHILLLLSCTACVHRIIGIWVQFEHGRFVLQQHKSKIHPGSQPVAVYHYRWLSGIIGIIMYCMCAQIYRHLSAFSLYVLVPIAEGHLVQLVCARGQSITAPCTDYLGSINQGYVWLCVPNL
jgi:hypothetical protein